MPRREMFTRVSLTKRGILSFTVLLLLLSATPLMPGTPQVVTPASAAIDAKTIFTAIDHDRVAEHLRYFTSLDSRVTGYPGCVAAADYIAETLTRYGVQGVERFRYPLTVPMDYGANLTVSEPAGGRALKIYALAPNLVQTCPTPPEGLEGQLIYARDGEYVSFNGLPVNGSIVLMDFNTGDNWKHAQLLGAKAALFIEPESTFWFQGERKYVNIPLNFPRLWVTKEDAQYLLTLLQQGEVHVNVKSYMQYENVRAEHIYGFIEGTDPVLKEEVLVLTAHYDSWSIAPSLDPGANEAVGIATLLELAKFFAENPPSRTLMFLALSGHNQALEGARQFIEEMYWGRLADKWWNPAYGTRKPKFFIGLDFNTLSRNIEAPLVAGWRYLLAGIPSAGTSMEILMSQGLTDFWEVIPTRVLMMQYQRDAEEAWTALYGKVPVTVENYRNAWTQAQEMGKSICNYYFAPVVLTIEPFFYPGPSSWSYVTVKHLATNLETPLDTYERLNWDNLWPQVEWVFYSFYRFQAEKDLGVVYMPEIEEGTGQVWRWRPARGVAIGGRYHWHGFSQVHGIAVTYNITTAKYDPLPGALVAVTLRGPTHWTSASNRVVKGTYVLKVGTDGRFTLVGWGGCAYAEGNQVAALNIEVFVLNSTGHILYAPDLGDYGGKQFPFHGLEHDRVTWGFKENPYQFVAFPCGSVYLPLLLNPNAVIAVGGAYITISVLDVVGHTPARFYGGMTDGWNTVIFLDPNRRYEFLLRPAGDEPTLILTNSPTPGAEGGGYQVSQGETIYLTLEDYARQFYHLNYGRAGKTAAYGIESPAASERLHETESLLQSAEDAYQSRLYDGWYSSSLLAWGVIRDAWFPSRTLFDDVVNSVIFFFALLIPFSFVLEKLITDFEDPKRKLVAILVIFTALALAMYMLHPGFHLAYSIFGVIIGFVGTVLTLPILFILWAEFQESFRRFKAELMGYTIREVEMLGAVGSTFAVGVAHMRRRRLRTILTMTSVAVVVYALIMTSSIAPIARYVTIDLGKTPPYTGVLMYITTPTAATGGMALPSYLVPPELLKLVKAEYWEVATIAPRAETVPLVWVEGVRIVGPKGNYTAYSILGLTPEEFNVSIPREVLKEGRWFEPGDYFACILSAERAEELGVKLGEAVSLGGSSVVKLWVVGIVDDLGFNQMRDIILDLRPVDRRAPLRPGVPPTKLLVKDFIMCPYQFTMDFPYDPSDPHVSNLSHLLSIAVKFHNPELTMQYVEKLALSLSRMFFFVGYGNATFVVQRSTIFQVTMTPTVLMPLLLSSIMLFNIILGSIYERRREIYTFSSVGLSPAHVGTMFMSETLVYALVAAVFGYLGAMVTNISMRSLGIQTGIITNYSSWAVTLAAVASAVATVLPSAFTFRTASRLVTPSLERRWAITTKPRGDEWVIPLPFRPLKGEVGGIFGYIVDFLQAHAVEHAGLGFTAKEPKYAHTEDVDQDTMSLSAMVQLEPYDVGVTQEAWIDVIAPKRTAHANVSVRLHRLTGTSVDWERFNYKFVDAVRKHLLLWRGLPDEKKQEYVQKGLRPS